MTPLLPQWTTELTTIIVTGEDQLGVEGPAQGYQQYLVPGVISTTDHARYYSFYAWVLYRFIFLANSSRLLKDFRGEFFKRHEVALIVASYSHHKDEGGIGGLVGAGNNNSNARHIWESGDPISLDADYFQNKLGGFGQYYRTAMQAMGIVDEPEESGWVYRLTDRGRELAEAYETSIADTSYARALKREGSLEFLSRKHALAYGEFGCICSHSLSSGKDRRLLRDAFFRFEQTGGKNLHVNRRLTLGVALDLVHKAQDQLQFGLVRPALYLGEYQPGLLYQPDKRIAAWADHWKLVEVRHLFTFGLQCLWAAFLLVLRERALGLTLANFMSWVQSQITIAVFEQSANVYLDSLCHAVKLNGHWRDAHAAFDKACRQKGDRDEYSLYLDAREQWDDAATLVRNGLQIFAQLFLRFYHRHAAQDSIWLEMAKRERIPLADTFNTLEAHLQSPQWTVGDLLIWLYNDLVFGQHEFVALEKLRYQGYDTFKFHYHDGVFFSVPGEYREPIRLAGLRLMNVLTILTDLGLILQDKEGNLRLSADGQSYRERVLDGAANDH